MWTGPESQDGRSIEMVGNAIQGFLRIDCGIGEFVGWQIHLFGCGTGKRIGWSMIEDS